MKQLYANNAKTTLASPIGMADVNVYVTDGSKFPSPGENEYFLITIEIDNQIEICQVTSRVGNTLVLSGRGKESSSSYTFPAGARVECRVTKETLERLSKAFIPLASVDYLIAPKDSYNDGYICNTYDPAGNPVVIVAKDQYTWRYLNYTPVATGTVISATTTSLTSSGVSASGLTPGKYLVQITSGQLTGYVRVISSVSNTVINWAQAMPLTPQAGDTYEIVKANSSIILEALAIGDDAVIMPLILGGN